MNVEAISKIFVSPHFDDAVYSCGGLIHHYSSLGCKVEVLTIFAGPYTGIASAAIKELHSNWGGQENVTEIRRMEDVSACKVLGAAARHLDNIDVLYRLDKYGNRIISFVPELYDQTKKVDDALVNSIAEQICLIEDHRVAECEYVFPLGVGFHIDHVIVAAVGRLLDRLGKCVRFYEDMPYASINNENLGAALNRFSKSVYKSHTVQIRIENKIEAALEYKTQYRTAAEQIKSVMTWCRRTPYSDEFVERCWRFQERDYITKKESSIIGMSCKIKSDQTALESDNISAEVISVIAKFHREARCEIEYKTIYFAENVSEDIISALSGLAEQREIYVLEKRSVVPIDEGRAWYKITTSQRRGDNLKDIVNNTESIVFIDLDSTAVGLSQIIRIVDSLIINNTPFILVKNLENRFQYHSEDVALRRVKRWVTEHLLRDLFSFNRVYSIYRFIVIILCIWRKVGNKNILLYRKNIIYHRRINAKRLVISNVIAFIIDCVNTIYSLTDIIFVGILFPISK